MRNRNNKFSYYEFVTIDGRKRVPLLKNKRDRISPMSFFIRCCDVNGCNYVVADACFGKQYCLSVDGSYSYVGKVRYAGGGRYVFV